MYQRHGILCDSRKCPRHNTAMEIATDSNTPVDTTLQWWCESCRGYWSEVLFERRAEAMDKTMFGVESNLKLNCPDCGSVDVLRDAPFSLSTRDGFICSSCSCHFEICYEILEPSSLSAKQIQEIQLWPEVNSVDLEAEEVTTEIIHPVMIETEACMFEHCSLHPDRPVTLIEKTRNITDERYRFAWRCADCPSGMSTDEFVFQFMKPYTYTFFRTAETPYQCRICHHGKFSGEGIHSSLRCDSCGTLMKLRFHSSCMPSLEGSRGTAPIKI
jgi:hypothetical protein